MPNSLLRRRSRRHSPILVVSPDPKLMPRPELLTLFSKLFRKCWQEAESRAEISRYENEVEKLELESWF